MPCAAAQNTQLLLYAYAYAHAFAYEQPAQSSSHAAHPERALLPPRPLSCPPPLSSPPQTPHRIAPPAPVIRTMASLNTSSNGPNITRSYQNVINTPPPSGPQSQSPTYGQWAVFAVTAPLVSAFQNDGGKESVLKVQSTGGTSSQPNGAQLLFRRHAETSCCIGHVSDCRLWEPQTAPAHGCAEATTKRQQVVR